MRKSKLTSSLTTSWWRNLSIAKKLYLVVGIMAVLIAAELLILHVAMRSLSAVRAFVVGESLWSKAQKDAIFSLQRFAITRNETDYQGFLENLKIPEGDHRARLELMKPNPNMDVVTRGFLDGKLHPEDIPRIVELLQRFYWIDHIARAIEIWSEADDYVSELRNSGIEYHDLIVTGSPDKKAIAALELRIGQLNQKLTSLEEDFSNVLSMGSRWVEHIVLVLLVFAVVIVEGVGLSLAFLTSRTLSNGLKELINVSKRIGQGDFSQKIVVNTNDELGKLANSVNEMGRMLEVSYRDMESRVAERTVELEALAAKNAELYRDTREALQSREEFLSIASHELKTPLTALYMQLQLLLASTKNMEANEKVELIRDRTEKSLLQAKKLTSLIEELLDLTRLRLGKPQLKKVECDIIAIAKEVLAQMAPTIARTTSTVSFTAPELLLGQFDSTRVTQILMNLISNAVKYGNGKPIELSVSKVDGMVEISVEDHGIGISKKDQRRVFERFERGAKRSGYEGLGLGLYITRQLVEAHGGKISLVSREGSGSTFKVTLSSV